MQELHAAQNITYYLESKYKKARVYGYSQYVQY